VETRKNSKEFKPMKALSLLVGQWTGQPAVVVVLVAAVVVIEFKETSRAEIPSGLQHTCTP